MVAPSRNGNEYRVLAALPTPAGLSLWREKRDGGEETGRGRTATRDLFRLGPRTVRTNEFLSDSHELAEVIAAEFDIVIDSVTEIEEGKAERARLRKERAAARRRLPSPLPRRLSKKGRVQTECLRIVMLWFARWSCSTAWRTSRCPLPRQLSSSADRPQTPLLRSRVATNLRFGLPGRRERERGPGYRG
jgi:hypothetical protein